MEKTIFNVYVVMDSQAQCDRMKQVCVDNGLQIEHDFTMFNKNWNVFEYATYFEHFGLWTSYGNQNQVTEAEFLQLLKEYKDGQ